MLNIYINTHIVYASHKHIQTKILNLNVHRPSKHAVTLTE